MRGIKTLISLTALLAGLAVTPSAQAQINIQIGIQPSCPYGYYDAEPYGCAPRGFYGSGYFHNGIFLGMGPWAGYGYGHGWGQYRFRGDGGGNYHGRGGYEANRGHWKNGRDDRDAEYRGNNGRGNGRNDARGYDRGNNGNRGAGRDDRGRSDDHKGRGDSHDGGGHGNDRHPDGGDRH
jgi:hypothetical protein